MTERFVVYKHKSSRLIKFLLPNLLLRHNYSSLLCDIYIIFRYDTSTTASDFLGIGFFLCDRVIEFVEYVKLSFDYKKKIVIIVSVHY